MANNVLFITSKYLKENSVIEENCEDKLLVNQITRAQDIDIHQILGTGLYNEIKSKVIGGTITGIYQTLMEDYIQPALVEWTVWRALPYITNKFENSSVVQKTGENTQPIDMSKEVYLRKDIKQTAEFFSERLKLYLCENQLSFPLFQNGGSGRDIIKPNYEYSAGIFLEGNHNKRGYSELDNQHNA